MGFTVLTFILIISVLVSLQAMESEALKNKLMFSPYRIKNNSELYRVFTHSWIHADFPHLLFNMISLYFLGSILENELIFYFGKFIGEIHFLLIYLLGGLFATVIPYLRNFNNPNYQSLGASGAVSAVVFAAILWRPDMELGLLVLPGVSFKAYWFGLFYILYELYMDKRGNTGIAHDAHIGGALWGILYVLAIHFEKGENFLQQIFS